MDTPARFVSFYSDLLDDEGLGERKGIPLADLVQEVRQEVDPLTDDALRIELRVRQRCCFEGCERLALPLAAVCKYHVGMAIDVPAFTTCSYPDCDSPVINPGLPEYGAFCAVHATSAEDYPLTPESCQAADEWLRNNNLEPNDPSIHLHVTQLFQKMSRRLSSYLQELRRPPQLLLEEPYVTPAYIDSEHCDAVVHSMVDQVLLARAALRGSR
ncbi:hypothetical protein GMRT_15061 [Giardia muris]|uniref:Uncharacterized protein n=1 Tax=Giardia muris TaxID=5742 RepID=A0A4Z1SML9_GIAMU|nr:hypothetical protein GMRT_15061 [Giardia muris]|eukprot:TNJ26934.1 hypothetical protein GMRT_15061 [Giardia muris]